MEQDIKDANARVMIEVIWFVKIFIRLDYDNWYL